LSDSIRETAICRVAVLNRAWYELEHHAPLLLNASVSDVPIDGLFVRAILVQEPGKWFGTKDVAMPNEEHAIVLAFTDALTLLGPISNSSAPAEASTFGVPAEVFSRLKEHFNETEIVELVATIGSYNLVSRFLLALDVGEREGEKGMVTALTNVINGKGGEKLEKVVNVSSLEPAPRIYVGK
jgi:alkylhydroperoxidase family enzyme